MDGNITNVQSIAQVVDSIISRRKQYRLPVIKEKRKLFEGIKNAIVELKSIDLDVVKEFLPLLYKAMSESGPDFESVLGKIKALDDSAKKLEGRFSRDNISIALVGHARMGKSTVLQSITKLDDDVIPTSSYTDCTGAVSVIQNSDSPFEINTLLIY